MQPALLPSCPQVYRILMSYTSIVQPISCDEAFLDVTGLSAPPITTATGTNPAPAAPVRPDPEALAARLRSDIHTATGCTASAGIGPNLLLARLATKRAKPNGQFRVTKQGALDFLCSLGVDQLPGGCLMGCSRLGVLFVRAAPGLTCMHATALPCLLLHAPS